MGVTEPVNVKYYIEPTEHVDVKYAIEYEYE
jgi:hypothetical protein